MSSKIDFAQIKRNIGLSVIAQIISLAVSFIMNLVFFVDRKCSNDHSMALG